MNSRTILGLSLPTNEPKTCFDLILPTVVNLKEVAPIATFLVNFQNPWTNRQKRECIDILRSAGFAVRATHSSYDTSKGVPFNRIRTDTCSLQPESKFFALIDDDMTFGGASKNKRSAGQKYVEAVHYMTTHPRCGILTMMKVARITKWLREHHLNKWLNDSHLVIPFECTGMHQVVGKGLMVRNLFPEGYSLPFGAMDVTGMGEETLTFSLANAKGYYRAKMFNVNVNHYENTSKTGEYLSGIAMYNWTTKNIVQYCKDNYASNVVPGYANIDDIRVIDRLISSYTNVDHNQLIDEIIYLNSRH